MSLSRRLVRSSRFGVSAALTGAVVPVVESLEQRRLLSVTPGTAARFDTTLGSFDVELFTDLTPLTVANFLDYVNAGAYDSTLLHRSVAGFILQGGGYDAFDYSEVPANPPVPNEFNPANSNVRGKIAMAKMGGDPDSATTEWFFNLDDNSSNLDNQNGGFTSFGMVLGGGMRIVDHLAAVPTYDFSQGNPGSPFGEIPVRGYFSEMTSDEIGDALLRTNSVSQRDLYTVVLGDTTERAIMFTDADGTQTTLTLAGTGAATLKLVGQNLAVTSDGTTYTITGGSIRLDEIQASGLSNRSAIAVNAVGGDGLVSVGGLRLTNAGNLRSLVFRDADGTLTRLTLNGPGTMSGGFSGDNLQLRVVGNTGFVTGSSVSLSELNLTGTNGASILSIGAAGGDGFAALGSILADGSLGGIVGNRATISGALVSVQGTLRILTLRSLQNATVNIHGSGGAGLMLNVAAVRDTDLISQKASIWSLRADSWFDTDESPNFVVAPYINTLRTRGGFEGGLRLSDPSANVPTPGVLRLRSATIGGTLDGHWNIDGGVRLLRVSSFSTRFDGTIGGDVWRFRAGVVRGNLTANSIDWMDASFMTDATLTLTRPYAAGATSLRRMRLNNALFRAMIRSEADLGMVNVAGVYHSFIFAGVSDAYTDVVQQKMVTDRANREATPAIPSTGIDVPVPVATDFVQPAALRNLNIRGFRGRNEAFVNSNIGATIIRNVGLRLTRLSQATELEPTPFFIAGQYIGILGLYGAETHQSVVFRNISSQDELAQSILRQNARLGDLTVAIARQDTDV